MSDPSNEQPAAVRVCCVCPTVTPAVRVARIIPRRVGLRSVVQVGVATSG